MVVIKFLPETNCLIEADRRDVLSDKLKGKLLVAGNFSCIAESTEVYISDSERTDVASTRLSGLRLETNSCSITSLSTIDVSRLFENMLIFRKSDLCRSHVGCLLFVMKFCERNL